MPYDVKKSGKKMKKTIGVAMAAACVASAQMAQAQTTLDTLKVQNLHEVVVKGVRAPKNAPFAVANIKSGELQKFATSGKEMPFLFSRTPGVLAWSENGMGTGAAYMRMRGAGGSRINITIDGVPLNSPEDQTVFWANMNSYASILGSAQIQRGIGTSTNGDGAFGGSISLATKAPSTVPYVELTGSFGSYNTWNTGINFSTNLIGNSLIFDGAYHETNTDGYIHGTSGRSGSYYGGLTWIGSNFKLSYKNIGNFEKTGQAWNGVAACDYEGNSLSSYGINSYKDMYNYGLGRYNSLMEDLVYPSTDGGRLSTKSFYFRDGRKWNQTTDNFYQNHNILNFVWQPSEHWSHNATVHYTYGYGYYNEFRRASALGKKFGLNVYDADGELIESEAVRRKGLTQNNYGALYNVSYRDDSWDVTGGLSAQLFRCNHWGYLTYIANEEVERQYLKDGGKYKYYDSDADKNDYSWFVKAAYNFGSGWNAFADMQMRIVDYTTDGVNDKFIKGKKDGRKFYTQQQLNIDETYVFYNPKAGISYTHGGHKAYASVAYANREPERNNFTDNSSAALPKAEHLFDTELGYQYRAANWYASANLYYMRYINQFVMTGAKSDIGEAITSNIKNSYRLGAELSAGWSPLQWLSLEGNAALSQNKLKNFTEEVEAWDTEAVHNTYAKSTLSYSPSAILNGFVDVHFGGFSATWHTNFVSRQYLDNTESSERSIPSYSQTDLSFNYTSKVSKALGMKQVTLGIDFNNIFNRHYAASGYVYYDWYNEGKRTSTIAYIPMAGFTCMTHVTLKF